MQPRLTPAFRGTRTSTGLISIAIRSKHSPKRILGFHARHLFSSTASPFTQRRDSEPLRILFCGSDHFSCEALSALHDLHTQNPALVESIDVLVRPGKPSGRGLKRIAVGPLFHLAESLKLPIHQRDTFTGWELPLPGRVTHPKTGEKTIVPLPSSKLTHRSHHHFNLIIAVSFGLFVPPRILAALPYGGLNIHPSLLPDLRGPAPLQWSILARRTHTGVTLQTLDAHVFDRGLILAQTPAPGLPIPENATTADLLNSLAPEGGRLLVEGLENGLHIKAGEALFSQAAPVAPAAPANKEPDKETSSAPNFELPWIRSRTVSTHSDKTLRTAPKITKVDLCIDWAREAWARDEELYGAHGAWTAEDLARRWRAVGSNARAPGLWTHANTMMNPEEQRIIWEDVEAVRCPAALRSAVLAIVQAQHPKAAMATEVQQQQEEISSAVANVSWAQTDELGLKTRSYRLPLFLEGDGSVVVPVQVPYRVLQDGRIVAVEHVEMAPDAVRVRRMKVAGSPSASAEKALKPFLETGLVVGELARIEYALNILTKELDVSEDYHRDEEGQVTSGTLTQMPFT